MDTCPHCKKPLPKGDARFDRAVERDREARMLETMRRRAPIVSLVEGPDGEPAIRFDKPEAVDFDQAPG